MRREDWVDPADVRRLFIFGAGGFGREVAWLAESVIPETAEVVFLVDAPEYLSEPVNGVAVILLADVQPRSGDAFVVALGDPATRRDAVEACERIGLVATTLIHPSVDRSRSVEIGPGGIICSRTVLTTNIQLGDHVIVNLGCTIGHDAVLGDFVTLAPGVHVSGNVSLGSGCSVGTGAVFINGSPGSPLAVGQGAVVAAGACVTRNVEPRAMVAGVPAMRKN